MCEPVTLGIMTAATVAGAVFSGAKSIQQGNYQASIARMNAGFAEQAAGASLLAGESRESVARIRSGGQIGSAKAGFGASGVVGEEGSPGEILADTRLMSEFEAQIIKNNAQREAWGHRVGAAGFVAQGSEYESSGVSGAVTSLIGGA